MVIYSIFTTLILIYLISLIKKNHLVILRLKNNINVLSEYLEDSSFENLKYKRILDETTQIVAILSNDLSLLDANKAALDLTDNTLKELIGTPYWELPWWSHSEHLQNQLVFFIERVWHGETVNIETTHFDKNGVIRDIDFVMKPILNENLEVEYIICMGYDITEQKKIQKELHILATKDSLTGVNIRRHFLNLAEENLILAKENSKDFYILMIDIDNFKRVNDTYGHDTGDDVLIKMAKTCEKSVDEFGFIGRMGGEEFAVVLNKCASDSEALKCAEEVRISIENLKVIFKEYEIRFTVSIGMSNLQHESDSLETLLSKADKALYEAKNTGKNKVVIY